MQMSLVFICVLIRWIATRHKYFVTHIYIFENDIFVESYNKVDVIFVCLKVIYGYFVLAWSYTPSVDETNDILHA